MAKRMTLLQLTMAQCKSNDTIPVKIRGVPGKEYEAPGLYELWKVAGPQLLESTVSMMEIKRDCITIYIRYKEYNTRTIKSVRD